MIDMLWAIINAPKLPEPQHGRLDANGACRRSVKRCTEIPPCGTRSETASEKGE